MNQSLVVQELVIVIAAKNLSPTILNLDFLKYSGIVPGDWELARAPIYTERVAQVIFTNGISIVAEPNRVMFLEMIEGKSFTSIEIPGIARKYVETLPNVEYQAMGLNPRGYVTFENQQDAARKYIGETLLSPGSWNEVGIAPMRATVNYAYTLERGNFNLSVSEASVRQPDETMTTIVLFSGNFNYDTAGNTESEKLAFLGQALENCEADLETYIDIVNNKFLVSSDQAKPVAIVPDLFAMSARAWLNPRVFWKSATVAMIWNFI